MNYIIDGVTLTPVQEEMYDVVHQMHHTLYGLCIALDKAEKELGKVHSFTCSLRITLNKISREFQLKLDELTEQGGEYVHLIKI